MKIRTSTMLMAAIVASLASFTSALHDAGCVPTFAWPSTYNVIDLPDGHRLYVEERDCPLGTSPPPPGCGFLLGGGTWVYEETNGIDAPWGSLQRGGFAVNPNGCTFPPEGDPLPCMIVVEDPIMDEACGHGPDRYIF